MRTSRRFIALAMVGGLLALAGCSASAPAEEAAPVETAPATIEAPEDDYFFLGDKPLPAEPQRIVALWRTGSSLAEMGAPVVGQLEGEISEAELAPDVFAPYADTKTVGTFEGVTLEDIIALDPDLIVGMDHGGISLDYEELAELYPVAILKIAEPTDVWDNYETVAALAGLSEDYTTESEALDARLAEIKSTYGDTLGEQEVTAVSAQGGSIWVSTSKSLAFRRLDAAGFGYNPSYTDNPERYVTELTRENIPSLAEQDVIFYDQNIDGTVSDEVQAVLDEPAFQELPAVKAGNLIALRGSTVYNFAAANLMVDDIAAAAEKLAQ